MYSAVVCYSCQVSEAQAFGKIWKVTMRTIYGIKNCIGISAYPTNFTVRIFRITTAFLKSVSLLQ